MQSPMGKVPPHNLQAMTKREASAYIDSLKAGEQPAPTYDSPEDLFSLIIMLSAVFMCGFMLGKDKK
jgi:hypothetical protein